MLRTWVTTRRRSSRNRSSISSAKRRDEHQLGSSGISRQGERGGCHGGLKACSRQLAGELGDGSSISRSAASAQYDQQHTGGEGAEPIHSRGLMSSSSATWLLPTSPNTTRLTTTAVGGTDDQGGRGGERKQRMRLEVAGSP